MFRYIMCHTVNMLRLFKLHFRTISINYSGKNIQPTFKHCNNSNGWYLLCIAVNVGEDCPVFDGLYEFCQLSTGGSVGE